MTDGSRNETTQDILHKIGIYLAHEYYDRMTAYEKNLVHSLDQARIATLQARGYAIDYVDLVYSGQRPTPERRGMDIHVLSTYAKICLIKPTAPVNRGRSDNSFAN